MKSLFRRMKWVTIVCMVIYIFNPIASIFTSVKAYAAASTPQSENVDNAPIESAALEGTRSLGDRTFGMAGVLDDRTVNASVISSANVIKNLSILNSWKAYQSNNITGGLYDAAFDGNKWLAISSYDNDYAGGNLYSLNSDHTWTKQDIQFNPGLNSIRSFTGLYYSGDKWVLTGNQKAIGGYDAFVATSPDGLNWSVKAPVIIHNSHGQGNFFSAASHGNTYVIVGGVNSRVDGEIYTSTDGGVTWIQSKTDSLTCFFKVIYGGGKFIAIGYNGAIYTSIDGINWTKSNFNYQVDFYSISYGNNKYIAVSADGVIAKSDDGVNWSISSSFIPLYSIAYANGEFVAVSDDAFYSTVDGNNWTREYTDIPGIPGGNEYIINIAYGGGIFLAVGMDGISAVRNSTIIASVPTIITSLPSVITSTGVTVGGNVTSDGNAAITERGIVYSANINPTINDSKVTATGTTGSFTTELTRLNANTVYHYRAYATNSQGTSYGVDQIFVTPAPSSPLDMFNQATTVAEMQAAVEKYPEYAFDNSQLSDGFFSHLKNDKEYVYKYMLENRPLGGFPNRTSVEHICNEGINVRSSYMLLHEVRDTWIFELAVMFPGGFDFGIDFSVLETFVNDSDYTEVDAIAQKLLDRIPEDGFIGPVDFQQALDECIQEYLMESVAKDKQNLEITFAPGDNANHVTKNINLPTKGENRSNISWTSSNPQSVANNGTVIASQENKEVTLTATITRGTQSLTKVFTVTVSAMIKNHYTVSFNTNQGSDIPSITVEEGGTVTKPADPVKEGYTFAGWYTDITFLTPYNFEQAVTTNLNLVANWKINRYTVTFDSNGGSAVPSSTVDYNTKMAAPAAPTKTGYSFAGWYKDSSLTEVWRFSTDKVTADTTLYAKWEILSYTVHFDTNGGNVVPDGIVNYSEKAIKPADPVKEGYTFEGWYTDTNFSTPYNFDQAVTSNLNLVAKWKINSYTVTFNSNGGSAVPSSTVDYNTKMAAPAAPTRTGYNFAGWYKDSELTQVWRFSTDKVTADTTLYAKWDIQSYTVHFDTNGGNVVQDEIVNYREKAIKPADPVKEGYTFEGWYTDTNSLTPYNFDQEVTTNLNLVAKWKINSYTVSFNSNGGSAVPSSTVDYNTKLGAPAEPTKTGYSFAGWYKDSGLTQVWKFNTDKVTADTTLYAKWVINSYTITFDSNGGSAVPNRIAEYNTKIEAPEVPTKLGYTFAGWYMDSALTEAWDFATGKVTNNTTLYAKWEKQSYTVHFDPNGGNNVADQIVKYQEKATKPVDPVKEGYTFEGWYTDISFLTAYNFDQAVITNLNLVAKWKINSYTVTFNSNGGSLVPNRIAEYNTNIEAPEEPTKTGYTFAGWYKNSGLTEAWSFTNDKVTNDTTLYAKWNINSYTVTFDSNGGSEVPSRIVEYNTNIEAPEEPTKTGYTFAGWYKDSGLTEAWSFANDKVTNNTTIYAKWEKQSYTVHFDTDGGNNVADEMVKYQEIATKPADPVKEGFTFEGWYTDTTFLTAYNFDQAVTSNLNLVAKWKINSYTVTFDSNGGNVVPNRIAEYNTNIESPKEPTKTGYTFTGWYKDSGLTEAWDFANDKVTNDTNLYAKWKINSYTVTFESNGGSAVPSRIVEYNTNIEAPKEPTKTGYIFAGWYKNKALTEAWNFASEKVTNNTVLYVKWLSSDATLSGLSISNNIALSPDFNPAIEHYTAKVDNGVSTISIKPILANQHATMTINGSMNPGPIKLSVGNNDITIVITAQNGTTKTYTITVKRLPADDPNSRQVDITVGQGQNGTAAKVEIVRKIENGVKVDEVNFDENKAKEVVQKAIAQKQDISTIILTDLPQNIADEMKVNILKKSLGQLGDNHIALQIQTPSVTVSLPKDTVQSLNRQGKDLYFRVVPIRKVTDQKKANQETLSSALVKKAVGDKTKDIHVYGNPVTIETNYSNLKTDVLFPLKDLSLPSDPAARKAFLNTLRVYVKHTDGTEELLKGEIITDKNGLPVSIKIQISKFSTFTVLGVPNKTSENKAPVASHVAISGAKVVGTVLKGTYLYTDADHDSQGASLFQWYRADNSKGQNKQIIKGAVHSTYTLTAKDKGKYIGFAVTPIASKGIKNGKPVMSIFIGKIGTKNTAPSVSGVKILGEATVGKTLHVTYKYQDADGDKEGKSIINWYRVTNGKKQLIKGAHTSSYKLTSKDVTKHLLVEVTPIAKSGVKTGLKKVSALSKAVKPKKVNYKGHLDLGVIKSKPYVERIGTLIKTKYNGQVTIKKSGVYYKLQANFKTKKQAKKVAIELKKKKLIINYYIR